MDLVFATNNQHKLLEINTILNDIFKIRSLKDITCNDEIPETGDTLEANASQKAWYIYEKYKINCFADDTGLEISALNNAPGVYSARYAGEERDAGKNMEKVLYNLRGKTNRKAQFRTVISLIIDGKELLFEGVVKGRIIENERGSKGFGYDPIFVPDGYNETFAEMDISVKNKISHRANAVNKLSAYLKKL
jgi:XTP/dITP diphosphohydrolase